MGFHGIKYNDLHHKSIEKLGTYSFLYSNTIKEEFNLHKIVSNVQTVLKVWQFRNLTLEGRIAELKSLAISKIVFQALIAQVPSPSHMAKALEQIQTFFSRNNTNPEIKHRAICQNFREGGLKNVYVRNKLATLQIT